MLAIVLISTLILAFWPRLAVIGGPSLRETELQRMSANYGGLSKRLAIHTLVLVLIAAILVGVFLWLASKWPNSTNELGYGLALLVGSIFGFQEAVFAVASRVLPSTSFFGLNTRYLYANPGRIQNNGRIQLVMTSLVIVGVVMYWLVVLK